MFECGVSAEVYSKDNDPVAVVLWRGNEPRPLMALKIAEDGAIRPFTLLSNDDIPPHDKRDAHFYVQVEATMQGGNPIAVVVRRDARSEPILSVGSENRALPALPSGHYIGKVVAIEDDKVVQDAGRGQLVSHDLAQFEKQPKVGDKLDIKYSDKVMTAAKELSQDGHSVSVSVNTR